MTPFKQLSAFNKLYTDDRGELSILLEERDIVIKNSVTKKGVFRGLHWQRDPYPQTKIIRVIEGQIIDFVIDMTSHDTSLYHRLVMPEHGWIKIDSRFAHGFYSFTNVKFEYICLGEYNEDAEVSISINDILQSEFQLEECLISEKDKKGMKLDIAEIIEIEV